MEKHGSGGDRINRLLFILWKIFKLEMMTAPMQLCVTAQALNRKTRGKRGSNLPTSAMHDIHSSLGYSRIQLISKVVQQGIARAGISATQRGVVDIHVLCSSDVYAVSNKLA